MLPIITRWELEGNEWERVRFPLNKGSYRDIPRDAVLHNSLIHRLRNVPNYSPGNNHGGSLAPCLKNKGTVPSFQPVLEASDQADPDHQTCTFPPSSGSERKGLANSCTVM